MIKSRPETLKQNRIYNARVKVWLGSLQNYTCRVCRELGIVRRATQCHHKYGRGWKRELLMVEKHWVPVCSEHHEWIHHNIEDARRMGWYAPKGEWNNPKPENPNENQ